VGKWQRRHAALQLLLQSRPLLQSELRIAPDLVSEGNAMARTAMIAGAVRVRTAMTAMIAGAVRAASTAKV
jgi:hypothetical protein